MSTRSDSDGKRNRKRLIVVLVVAVALVGALVGGGAILWSQHGERISQTLGWTSNDYEGTGSGEVVVVIEQGEIGEDIANTLAEEDVVKTPEAFYDLLIEQDPAVEFHPGAYQVRGQMSAESALAALQDPENRVPLTAVVPEGYTVEQTLERISEGARIPLDELQDAAEDPSAYGLPEGVDSLEGWLFPATYEFELDTTAEQAIQRLVDEQKAVLDDLGVAEDDRERVLTIAAMVQKESGTMEDFSRVSRVIHNRLDEGMRLQMDSTAQYGMGEHHDGSVWSTDEALEDDNDWNTYVHKGLPAGPIANPGRDAIAAALEPADGDWLYFVVSPGGTGESTFSETQAEHDKAVQEYRDWCEATPDSGC